MGLPELQEFYVAAGFPREVARFVTDGKWMVGLMFEALGVSIKPPVL